MDTGGVADITTGCKGLGLSISPRCLCLSVFLKKAVLECESVRMKLMRFEREKRGKGDEWGHNNMWLGGE